VKTYNGALGVDIHEKDHQTILEMAKAAGLATGNVSTAELQDATPAALVSHVTSRKCYGPSVTSEKCPTNALEKGGKGSITEQLLNARADVTLGGGAKTFAETATAGDWQGKTLREQAQARGYQLVSDAASLAAITRQIRINRCWVCSRMATCRCAGKAKGLLPRQHRQTCGDLYAES
jgi:alkaline phosphatase